MPRLVLGIVSAAVLLGAGPAHIASAPQIRTHDNRVAAGNFKDGVLTLRLELSSGEWHPDRENDAGITVHAFAEEGKAALVPGPLIRVPEGTQIHVFVHNPLRDSALTLYGLSTRGTTIAPEDDSIQVAAGATRELRFAAGAAGTYFYMGRVGSEGRNNRGQDPRMGRRGADAELGGAFVVDPRGVAAAWRDRIFVLTLWGNDRAPGEAPGPNDPILRFAMNGKSWPNTERLAYSTGDSVRFRIVNISNAAHPMHLHGF